MSSGGAERNRDPVPRSSSSSAARRSSREAGRGRGGSQQKNNRPATTTCSVRQETGPTRRRGMEARRGRGRNTGEALKMREEEYRRLNEELEVKTATLVKEAEDLMKEHISFVSEDSVVLSEGEQEEEEEEKEVEIRPRTTAFGWRGRRESPPSAERPKTSSASNHHKEDSLKHLPCSNRTAGGGGGRGKVEAGGRGGGGERGVGIPLSLTDDIERTVRQLEERLADEEDMEEEGERVERRRSLQLTMDDVVPEVAEEMGSEALTRFLKAKLRVMQEEVDRLSAENSSKDKQLSSAEATLKELTEQNTKLKNGHHSMQTQLNRYKQLSSDMQHKCEGLEAQLVALRREMDSMKAAQRKAASGHSAVEVRLNRALEEAERYKSELHKTRTDSKEVSKQERQRVEEMEAENRRLEKQKAELMTAFKKQMKLIDILKRQKLHIEAARMLSFTEEEFIKSLNWDTT